MSPSVCLAVVLLAFACVSFAQVNSFSANFQVRRPNTGGAFSVGRLKYSRAEYAMVYEYADRNYTEIHIFSPLFGTNEFELANLTQWAYQTGSTCTGCKAASLNYSFPVYYRNLSVYQAGSLPDYKGCQHFTPINAASTNVTDIWFNPTNDYICRATWADGADYVFDFVTPTSFTAANFSEPADCICRGPEPQTDILILIDRSASIGSREYDNARATARAFARKFDVSPSKVNVMIAQFEEEVEVVLQFFQGVSLTNIDAAVNTMSCACGQTTIANVGQGVWKETPDKKDKICCGKRTSISKALVRAADTLFPAARPGSKKILMVISDGRFNTKLDGTPCTDIFSCGGDLIAALGELFNRWPGIKIFGIGVGDTDKINMGTLVGNRKEHYCNSSDFWKHKTPPIVASVGCPITTTFCDPTTCCGFCECGECMQPTDCDPNPDKCNPSGLYGGRCCSTRPLTCPESTLCSASFCDPDFGCVTQEYKCPTIGDALQQLCWDRVCNPNTGACASFYNPVNSSCNPSECTTDAECNDNDECTTDTCQGQGGVGSCVWTRKQCDDGNLCTRDVCVNPNVGCEHIDVTSECVDGVPCTTDFCAPSIGCQFIPQSCDDNRPCTNDFCNISLGRCVNEDFICGPYADANGNCTISLCQFDECIYVQDKCVYNLLGEGRLSSGALAGVVIGVTIGAALLAVGAFVTFRIVKSSKAEESGGSAGDFAAE